MTRSPADLAAIKNELTTDPKILGLTIFEADDETNANKLTAVREGDVGFVKTLLIKKRSLSTVAIFNAIDHIEHQGLTTQQERWFSELLSLEQIDPFTNSNLISGLDDMFGIESVSYTAYHDLLMQDGSRIEQMFQAGLLEVGGSVTPSEIAYARATT